MLKAQSLKKDRVHLPNLLCSLLVVGHDGERGREGTQATASMIEVKLDGSCDVVGVVRGQKSSPSRS